MSDFDSDDIAAMRKQGDLTAFLRSRISSGPKAAKKPPPWKPPGTGPAAPINQVLPSSAWQAALDDYRNSSPEQTEQPCHCPACNRARTNDSKRSSR